MSTTNESIWNDIRRRGNGSDVKKEDDVNLLDIDGLYDYIKSKYEKYVFDLDKDTFGILNKRNIVVDIISNVSLFTSYDKSGKLDHILLSWTKVKIGMPFFDKLSERFNVQSPNVCRRRITEKDGTCTNQTYIDVIDFFLKNMDNMLVNESIWNDIRRRGNGDGVKQEEFTEEFIDKVKSDLICFTMSVVNYIENYELTFDGFYKYLEEIENPDEVKKIIYYVKTHKDECDKLLEKDIKFENKLLDEKINVYLLRFVDNIVYDEKYHNTLSDIKKFASEIFKGHKSSYDFHINKKLVFKDKSELFNDYIEDKWEDGSLKQKIDDLIKNENDEISKYGFVKEPGKTISETVNDWWYSLDEDKRNDLGWDEFGEDAEGEYYSDHNPDYNEYTGEDFEADEWWDDAYGIRRVKIYCSEHSKTNESVWGDIRKQGLGDTLKKEDDPFVDRDIDSLSKYEFCDYLNFHYEPLMGRSIHTNEHTREVTIPIYIHQGYAHMYATFNDDSKLVDISLPLTQKNPPRLYNRMCKKFNVIHTRPHWSYIKPIDGDELTNTFCLEVIDFILENVNHPLLKKIVLHKVKKLNESVWGDIRKRGNGTDVKKEDEMTQDDLEALNDFIFGFATRVVWDGVRDSLTNFLKYIDENPEALDCDIDRVKKYVEDNWHKSICDDVEAAIEQEDKEKEEGMNESIWNDIRRRGNGTDVRKEDDMTSDDYRNLKVILKMFGREVRFFGNHKNQKFFPVNAKKYEITLEDCLYFIDVLVDGKFTGADFSKLKRYIEVNWERDPMIKNIIQWTVDGKNSKEIDQEIRNASKSDEFWDLNECDGVPGGLTPADVGGMGSAYFPGPNGEPGSGDLPLPTGIVYKQVAPFDTFIKMRRPKKNKKKKFRKEDELCVHSENPPIYSHVDDFRDYVDRTYNNIDKRK